MKRLVSILKIGLLAGLIAVIAMAIGNQLMFTTSEQAFINTRLTVLRADLNGTISTNPALTVGSAIRKDQVLAEITNGRNFWTPWTGTTQR